MFDPSNSYFKEILTSTAIHSHRRTPPHQSPRSLLSTNNSVGVVMGCFTPHKNKKGERAVRRGLQFFAPLRGR